MTKNSSSVCKQWFCLFYICVWRDLHVAMYDAHMISCLSLYFSVKEKVKVKEGCKETGREKVKNTQRFGTC